MGSAVRGHRPEADVTSYSLGSAMSKVRHPRGLPHHDQQQPARKRIEGTGVADLARIPRRAIRTMSKLVGPTGLSTSTTQDIAGHAISQRGLAPALSTQP